MSNIFSMASSQTPHTLYCSPSKQRPTHQHSYWDLLILQVAVQTSRSLANSDRQLTWTCSKEVTSQWPPNLLQLLLVLWNQCQTCWPQKQLVAHAAYTSTHPCLTTLSPIFHLGWVFPNPALTTDTSVVDTNKQKQKTAINGDLATLLKRTSRGCLNALSNGSRPCKDPSIPMEAFKKAETETFAKYAHTARRKDPWNMLYYYIVYWITDMTIFCCSLSSRQSGALPRLLWYKYLCSRRKI